MLQCAPQPGCAKYEVYLAQWIAPRENRTQAKEWSGIELCILMYPFLMPRFCSLELMCILVHVRLGGGRLSSRTSLPYG